MTAFGTAAASKARKYWLYFMGRRPQDSSKWASGRLTLRLSRRQPRIRPTVKEIVEIRRIITAPPASVAPETKEVKKRATISALLKMALLTPIPTSQHVETAASTQRLETIVVPSAVPQTINLWTRLQCKKPKEDFNQERALFWSDRFANCFQENWDALEKSRVELQDAEYTRALSESIIQNPKPPVPPDLIGSVVPRGKRNRHPKKHKPRAMALPPGSGIIHEVSDLRRCIRCFNYTTKTNPSTDCICNEVVLRESVRDDLARLVLNPDDTLFPVESRWNSDNPSPHHPHPSFPSSSSSPYDYDVHSDDCESDDGYMYM